MTPRCGTVLIIVAGLSGLLASIALAFLARIQNNGAGDQEVLQEAQARIMLVAACNYIQEASRIGWEDKRYQGAFHAETYGWIDVRDGQMGPKYNSSSDIITTGNKIDETPYQDKTGMAQALFPIGVARRFSMHRQIRPPYAIQNRVCYNPIVTDRNHPDYSNLKAYLRYPDPQPAVDNGYGTPSNRKPQGEIESKSSAFLNAQFKIWAQGDITPRPETVGIAWFRLLREPAGSVFVVTCGAGSSMGWRSWKELMSIDPEFARNYFGNEAGFLAAQQQEVRHFYRVEWSAAVTANDNNVLFHPNEYIDNYRLYPVNMGQALANTILDLEEQGSQFYTHNLGGTIQWVQRLREEPANW